MKRKLFGGFHSLKETVKAAVFVSGLFCRGLTAGGSRFRTAFAILSSEKELARGKGEHIEDRVRRRVRHPDHAVPGAGPS